MGPYVFIRSWVVHSAFRPYGEWSVYFIPCIISIDVGLYLYTIWCLLNDECRDIKWFWFWIRKLLVKVPNRQSLDAHFSIIFSIKERWIMQISGTRAISWWMKCGGQRMGESLIHFGLYFFATKYDLHTKYLLGARNMSFMLVQCYNSQWKGGTVYSVSFQ
jgi:hypothetical protein